MAIAELPEGEKYRDAMRKSAEGKPWKLGPRPYHADDHRVRQAGAELYLHDRDPREIADLKSRFDYILAHPSEGAWTLIKPRITACWIKRNIGLPWKRPRLR